MPETPESTRDQCRSTRPPLFASAPSQASHVKNKVEKKDAQNRLEAERESLAAAAGPRSLPLVYLNYPPLPSAPSAHGD